MADETAANRTAVDPVALPPLALAYVGDAVYELWVRERLITTAGNALKPRDLHRQALGWVRAEAQAAALEAIRPLLTEAEADIVRRARNQRPGHPAAAGQAAYRLSTGLEALCGFLYLQGDEQRLDQLLTAASAVLPWRSGTEAQA